MSDFFEDFSDEVEDNAGGYAALGGLAALNNQRASLKKLSGIQEQLKRSSSSFCEDRERAFSNRKATVCVTTGPDRGAKVYC